MSVFFTPEVMECLRRNLALSPHTQLLMDNPVHAYLCEGDACRQRVNASEVTEAKE